MKILFLAPLPPPLTGHSFAAKVVLDDLATRHDVCVVDLGKGSLHDGRVTWERMREVARLLAAIHRAQRDADVIYLTISESLAGNIKDLLIYALCAGRMNRVVIHLHGGTIGTQLFDRFRLLRRANAVAIRRMGGVVISGKSHLQTFDRMIDRRRIHIVPNFAHDELFVDEAVIREKFATPLPLRVLYMSGMLQMKGYDVLADAYLALPPATQALIRVDFAGKFDSADAQARFESKIAGVPRLAYHGIVDNDTKARLFTQAHVFCLPTAFLEGQPISILEAYAAGCVVLTTGPSGILDIFTPGANGREVLPRSPESVRDALAGLVQDADRLLTMALSNRREAEARYRLTRFNAAVAVIIEGLAVDESPVGDTGR